MNDCLFCKMVAGDITPDVVFENDEFLAFNDINPQAPTHVLIIPKRHISTLNDMDDALLLGNLLQLSAQLSKQLNVAEIGYRVVINCNAHGGQAVYHLHMHLLAGRQMLWPPG